jgi:hypothetical protein
MLPVRSAPLGTTQVTDKTLAGDRINPMTENDREDAAGPSEPVHSQPSYLQVPALDVTESAGFYEKVFGWHVEPPHPSFGTNGGEVLDGPSADGSERWLATIRDPGGNVLGIAQNRPQ